MINNILSACVFIQQTIYVPLRMKVVVSYKLFVKHCNSSKIQLVPSCTKWCVLCLFLIFMSAKEGLELGHKTLF